MPRRCSAVPTRILVPGGFGKRGFEGKVQAVKYARENNVPYFGICYGMHAAVVDFARHVAGLTEADTSENDHNTPDPVIALITEWTTAAGEIEQRHGSSDLGGTMRQGVGLESAFLRAQTHGAAQIGLPSRFSMSPARSSHSVISSITGCFAGSIGFA